MEARYHRAQLFPLAYFFRRSGFACVTVLLFEYPVLQFACNGLLTLLYLAYLASDRYNFESKSRQIVEIGTELLYLLICTIMLQMSNPTYREDESTEAIEKAFLCCVGLVIILNVIYVIHTAIQNNKESKRKKLLEKNKKTHEENIKYIQMKAKEKRHDEEERARNAFVIEPPLKAIPEESERDSQASQRKAKDELGFPLDNLLDIITSPLNAAPAKKSKRKKKIKSKKKA